MTAQRHKIKLAGRIVLAQWYRARLTGERSGFDAQFQQPEMTLGINELKQQKSSGDD